MNSRERALTPWSNDPVSDRPGEALYLRDEDSGELWGPTAAPLYSLKEGHTARHGQGYSRFEHESHGIHAELLLFVPLQDPIKISRLRVRNVSDGIAAFPSPPTSNGYWASPARHPRLISSPSWMH